MVPASSAKVPRVSAYSGSRRARLPYAYGALTLSGRLSQSRSARQHGPLLRSEPRGARAPVWPPPRSLAATCGIDVSFLSSGYLDVSVCRVPLRALWIGARMHGSSPCGFPHSDTCGSAGMCPSPQLFAACRVFRRLPVPRHPPRALSAWPVPPSGSPERDALSFAKKLSRKIYKYDAESKNYWYLT